MKVAAITGKREGGLEEQPVPHGSGNLVVIKNTVVPMCTEYKGYAGGWGGSCLGHEAAGEVVEVDGHARVKVGDRVVAMPLYACGSCRYCLSGEYIYCQNGLDVHAASGNTTGTATYAEYMVKPEWQLLPVPDDLSIEHASMACCGLGPTFGAMQRMAVDAFDTLLITGMGPVGLGGVVNGVYRGAKVIAVESHPYRADLALTLGARAVVNPAEPDALERIREAAGTSGVDKGIDCSGSPQAQRLLVDAVRRRGQVAFVGEAGEFTLRISDDMIRKGLTLHGNWHWGMADAPRLWHVIRETGPLIDRLITHTFPLSEVTAAWELQTIGNCGKVLLYP
jgi:L-iditol 2-dehydrogenase